MKDDCNKTTWPRVVVFCAVLIAAVALATFVPTGIQAQNTRYPRIIDRDTVAYGNAYGEWSVLWWQWALSIPVGSHPLFDKGSINEGQAGPVWFLGGKFCANGDTTCGFSNIIRNGEVPRDKALFVAIFNNEDSVLEEVQSAQPRTQIFDLRAGSRGQYRQCDGQRDD